MAQLRRRSVELTTERLILREFKQGDWPDVLAYQNDPLYLRYYDWTERTPEAVQDFVQMFLTQQQEQPRIKFQLAVVLKSSQQLIGNCGIRMKSADAHEGDIGYELSPIHWGHGYATEAGAPLWLLGLRSSDCTASGPGASRRMLVRHMSYKNWACSRKDGYARMNTSKAAGGIRCCLVCWTTNGNPTNLFFLGTSQHSHLILAEEMNSASICIQRSEADSLREPLLRSVIQSLQLPGGSHGLDAGCGIGLQATMLAEAVGRDGHISGLDIDYELLKYGNDPVRRAGYLGRITFCGGDAGSLPFEDDALIGPGARIVSAILSEN
jgi:hypothetical protein